ncbi:AraC family transcriptional regulator [Stagnihabitans tardus]|uniref:Helix-turn-helix domain-containing protein n=1 Tax=Stagnihabitans tardus TaxID=2699202 RepID=A0AAE5BVE1_9RHOB|nr:AraC family transcriptional regulator [Stagnihabitans tardus]NBZ87724.1 helix-turn-helix domain-containing protein [Stagnihabitans tardus]
MLSALLSHGHDVTQGSAPRPARLQAFAVAAGYEQRRNETYSWDGMQRGASPFLVIQHTLVGEGRLDYAGRPYRLRPGDCMLVTMPHAHRYWLERGGQWEYFWLLLTGAEPLRLARDILAHAGPVLRPDAAQTDRLAAATLALLTGQSLAGAASAQAYAAMMALQDMAFAMPPPPNHPPPIARALSHVEAHLAENLTIDRLAQVAGQSRAHFVRQFTAALGLPPSAHVEARRLDRVERLLLASELTVDQIARMAGYADGNYLAKVFRRARGLSPLAWRATRAEAERG